MKKQVKSFSDYMKKNEAFLIGGEAGDMIISLEKIKSYVKVADEFLNYLLKEVNDQSVEMHDDNAMGLKYDLDSIEDKFKIVAAGMKDYLNDMKYLKNK